MYNRLWVLQIDTYHKRRISFQSSCFCLCLQAKVQKSNARAQELRRCLITNLLLPRSIDRYGTFSEFAEPASYNAATRVLLDHSLKTITYLVLISSFRPPWTLPSCQLFSAFHKALPLLWLFIRVSCQLPSSLNQPLLHIMSPILTMSLPSHYQISWLSTGCFSCQQPHQLVLAKSAKAFYSYSTIFLVSSAKLFFYFFSVFYSSKLLLFLSRFNCSPHDLVLTATVSPQHLQ